MSKQESCDKISEILDLPITILGEGSSVDKDWLSILFHRLNFLSIEVENTKHGLFDGILRLLGAEPSSEFFEKSKSEGGTVTSEGMEKALNLILTWGQLSSMMEIEEFVSPRDLSTKICEGELPYWVIDAGHETLSSTELDFCQLKPELEAYSCMNDLSILSLEFLEFSISQIESSKNENREDDVQSRIGDSAEDRPDAVALTDEIDSHLEMPEIATLLAQIDRKVLKLDPPWQRKVVWGTSKQRQLLKSVMLNLPLPSFILFKLPDSSHREVVDGKQRLTSLYLFYKDEIRFPRINIAEDRNLGKFTLRDCSDKLFSELHPEAQEKMIGLTVHTSTLRGISPQTIYEIFTIYNSSGTRLNAVEIRNAAFQDHEVHKAMVELTGEQETESKWSTDTEYLRRIIGNGKTDANRYKYLAFVERYLGYSRAYNEGGKAGFKKLTTTKSIKAFYDTEDHADADNAQSITEEFEKGFSFCLTNLNTPFHFAGKFHALKATNSLILYKLLMNTIESKKISLKEAKTILDRIISAEPPSNQNTSTIWTYHISSVDELWNAMNKQQRSNLEDYNSDYLDKLLPLRNE